MVIDPKFRVFYLLQFIILLLSLALVDYPLFFSIQTTILVRPTYMTYPTGFVIFAAVTVLRLFIVGFPLFQNPKNNSGNPLLRRRFTLLLVPVGVYYLFALLWIPMDWSATPPSAPFEFLQIVLGVDFFIIQSGFSFAAIHKINPEALKDLSSPTSHIRFYLMAVALLIHFIVLGFRMDTPQLDAAAFASASVGSFLAFSLLIYENVREIGKITDEYIIRTLEQTLISMKKHILLFNSPSRSFEALPFDRGICNDDRTINIWFAGTQFEREGVVQIPVRCDIILFEDISLPSTENIVFSGISSLFGQVYIRRIRAHYSSAAIYTIGIARNSANLSVLGMVNERYAQYSLVFDPAPEGFEAWRERLSGPRDIHPLRILTAQRATNNIQGIQLAPEIRILFFDFIEGYVSTGRFLTLSVLSSRFLTTEGNAKPVNVLIFGSGRKLRYIIQSVYVSCKNLVDTDRIRFCVVTDDDYIIKASEKIRIWGISNRYRWRIPVSYSNGILQNVNVDVIINDNSGPKFLAEIIEKERPDVVGIFVGEQKQNTRLIYDVVRYISNTNYPSFNIVGAVCFDELDEIRSLVGSHTRRWLHNTVLQLEGIKDVSNYLLSIVSRLHIPENLSLHIPGAMLQSNRSKDKDAIIKTRINIGRKSITLRHLNPFNIAFCVSDNPGTLSMILDTIYSEESIPSIPETDSLFAISFRNVFAQNCPRFRERDSEGELLPSHFVLSGAAYFDFTHNEYECSRNPNIPPKIVRASCNLQGCAESNNDWGVLTLRRVIDTYGKTDPVECNQRAICPVAFCSDKICKSPPSPEYPPNENDTLERVYQREILEDTDLSQMLPPVGGANIKVCLKNLPGATAACLRLLLEAKISRILEPSINHRPTLHLEAGKNYSDVGYIWSCQDIALSDGKPAYIELCGTECKVEGIADDLEDTSITSIDIDISEIIDAILITPECDFERWSEYAQGIANILWPDFEVHIQGTTNMKTSILIRRKSFMHLCDDMDCSIARCNLGVMITRPILQVFANFNIAVSTLELVRELGTIPDEVKTAIQRIAIASEDTHLKRLLRDIEDNDSDVQKILQSWLPNVLLSTCTKPYDCRQQASANVSGCANPSLRIRNLANRIRVLLEFALLHNHFAQVTPLFFAMNNKSNHSSDWKKKYATCYGILDPSPEYPITGIYHPCRDCSFRGYTIDSTLEDNDAPEKILVPYNQGSIPNCISRLKESISTIRNLLVSMNLQSLEDEIESSMLPFQCANDQEFRQLIDIIFGTTTTIGRLDSIFQFTRAYLWPVHYEPQTASVHDRIRRQIRDYVVRYQEGAQTSLSDDYSYPVDHALLGRIFAVSEVLRFLPLAPGPYVELVSYIEEWDATWVTAKKKKPLTLSSPIDFILKPSG